MSPNVRLVMNQLVDNTYGDFHSLYDYLIHGNDEFFIVCEIKSLSDHDYIAAYHHAYEGVDFKVKGFDSIEEARAYSNKAADDFKSEVDCWSDERGINSITLDDNNEWHIWTSQLVHETAIHCQQAAA